MSPCSIHTDPDRRDIQCFLDVRQRGEGVNDAATIS